MEWLAGFNGGALRMATMRLNDAATTCLADAAIRAGGIEEAPGTLADFYVSRNPL